MLLCSGCKACQIACKDKNDLPVGIFFREVKSYENNPYPDTVCFNYSFSCNHCEKPMCVRSCPTGAMYISEDKTVQHNDKLCIRCRYCVSGCPYKIPQFINERRIGKCDSCKDLRHEGKEPACVNACTMNCLEWGELDVLRDKHCDRQLVSDISVLPSSHTTKPSILIDPKKIAIKEGINDGKR